MSSGKLDKNTSTRLLELLAAPLKEGESAAGRMQYIQDLYEQGLFEQSKLTWWQRIRSKIKDWL